VRGEALRIDRRRRHDHLQIRPRGQDPLQIAEQEIDVKAALVRLVDDDRVVAAQQPVTLDLGQQQAVGQQPQQRVLARVVAEAHRVADGLAEGDVELVGDSLGDRARGEPPRLRVRDRPAHAAPELETHLRQLRRLAGAGLAGHDHDLVLADRRQQVLAARADRQRLGIADGRNRRPAPLDALDRLDDVTLEPLAALGVALLQSVQPLAEPVLVLERELGKLRP
jgi:hypothetical protein